MPGFVPGAPRQYVGMPNNTGAGIFPYVGLNANRSLAHSGYVPVPMSNQPFVPATLQAQSVYAETMISNAAQHVMINDVDGDSSIKKMVQVVKLAENPFKTSNNNYFKLNGELLHNKDNDYQLTAYYQDPNAGHVYALMSIPTTLQADNGTTIKVISRVAQKMVLVGINCMKSKYIVIPACVHIDADNDNKVSAGDAIFPITEMWGCNLYGTTTSQADPHWIQPHEYMMESKQTTVLYTIEGGQIVEDTPVVTSIPYSFYAPFIEKIDFSYVSHVAHARFFSDMGCFTIFHLPSVVEIKSKDLPYPFYGRFLCNALTNRLSLPALARVENMFFCKGCSRLTFFVAPILEEIVETVFLQDCNMLEVLSLGKLHKIHGCDYFCKGCSSLKYLRLPCNLSLRAHANKKSTFQIEAIRMRYGVHNDEDVAGSGAMVGFLAGCSNLSNGHKDDEGNFVIDSDLFNSNQMSMEYRMPQFRGIELVMSGKFFDYGRWYTSNYTGDQATNCTFYENVWSGAYLKNGAFANDSLTPATETVKSVQGNDVSLNIARTNDGLAVLFADAAQATTCANLNNASIWVPVDYRTALDNTVEDCTTVRDRLYIIQLPYITFNTDAASNLAGAEGKGVVEAAAPIVAPAGKSVAALIDGFMKLCLGFNQLY